jgi:RHS repeat-associated protein
LTQLLAVYDASNNLLMRFEYSDSRMPNVMTKGSETYYLTYDQVGSLRAVANSIGAVVKRIDYDSFGNILADTAPAFTVPFGFAGGLHDRDVGLVRFGYRDYDPATGRWAAKDPIGFAGGDVDLYGYVLNDPINFVDPNGELRIPFTDINIDAGEGYGTDALTYWANKGATTDNPWAGGFYNVMGGLSALWTPCTSDEREPYRVPREGILREFRGRVPCMIKPTLI